MEEVQEFRKRVREEVKELGVVGLVFLFFKYLIDYLLVYIFDFRFFIYKIEEIDFLYYKFVAEIIGERVVIVSIYRQCLMFVNIFIIIQVGVGNQFSFFFCYYVIFSFECLFLGWRGQGMLGFFWLFFNVEYII